MDAREKAETIAHLKTAGVACGLTLLGVFAAWYCFGSFFLSHYYVDTSVPYIDTYTPPDPPKGYTFYPEK